MDTLGSLFEFLGPFRDLLVEHLRPSPELPEKERSEYLDKIRHSVDQGEPAKAASASKALFGARIRGEIIAKIWGHDWDPYWMAGKFLEAGGERAFRWDDNAKTLRPIPSGMDVSPYWAMGSFEKLRRNATNSAFISLCGSVLCITVGYFAIHKNITADPHPAHNAFTLISLITFWTIITLLFIAIFIGAMKNEVKYTAANTFWTAWCSKEEPLDPVQKEDESATNSSHNLRKPTRTWAIQNGILTGGIYAMVITQIVSRFHSTYYPEIFLFAIIMASAICSKKWFGIQAGQLTQPPVWLRICTMAFNFLTLPSIAYFSWAILQPASEYHGWRLLIVILLCTISLIFSGINARMWLKK